MSSSYRYRLKKMLEPLGVTVVSVQPWEGARPKSWDLCPFDEGAVHFRQKIIYSPPETKFGTLVHEAGHVVASAQPPESSNEGAWLWWELAVAYLIGKDRGVWAWRRDSMDYVLTNNGALTVADVSFRHLLRRAKKSVVHGKAGGFFDNEGNLIRLGRSLSS